LDKGLVLLSGLVLASYILVTLFIPIPLFIKYENILLILLYIVSLYLFNRGVYWPLPILITFNIGRLSRSIVTSTGEVGERALEHIPLLILLVVFLIYVLYRAGRGIQEG